MTRTMHTDDGRKIEPSVLVAAMRQPAMYPNSPDTVDFQQTHISFVFLAGDLVYKVKKPVRFSFLDFSSLENRRRDCLAEVGLNRRLAPDTYLDVVSICSEQDRLFFGDLNDRRAVEYAVRMRRLPGDRLLDHLLRQNRVSTAMIDDVARRLADFHRQAQQGTEITANGSSESIRRILADNYDNGRRFRGITLSADDDDAIQKFALDFLDRHAGRFRKRQEEGFIRECHGDLHTEHVCFDDELVIFDCIEFNTQFRYIDTASDIAFLAMDLDFHDRSDLSARFVDQYIKESDDQDARFLQAFYKCYRAYVRGKVDSLKSVEPELSPGEREEALVSARRHFDLAYRYTWTDSPALVVVCGLSGTGKSVVARELARRTGFAHYNSDVIRKQLAGIKPTDRIRGEFDSGIYTKEFSHRTYRQLFDSARHAIAERRGAILDATFQLREGRDEARGIAAAAGVPLLFVECMCDAREVERRLHTRAAEGNDASDADWQVYQEQRRRFENFEEYDMSDRLPLDTSGDIGDCSRRIETRLRPTVGV